MIAYELSDPRIGDATVTEVLVSPDMKHAQVRLHMNDGKDATVPTIEALNHAKPFLKRKLAERLNLFRIPELHFESDIATGGNHDRMPHLLRRIRRGRPKDLEPS